MTINRYPLSWPLDRPRTPMRDRKRAVFSHGKKPLTVATAIQRLLSEIKGFTSAGHAWVINPEKVIVSSNLQTRIDGLPRSGQKEPDDPGVAVYLKLRGKDYCFACDRWDKVGDNIAAIAKHLEAIRGMERWGVGSLNQAFQGYLALPEKSSGVGWWTVLGVSPNASVEEIKQAYRRLSLENHPDAGGDRDDWEKVQQAYEIAKEAIA